MFAPGDRTGWACCSRPATAHPGIRTRYGSATSIPLLQKLGIERCGFHAFRHGNATVMDQELVPIATRQNRLGQSDARTTMGYTHVISEDSRRFAECFGQLLTADNA